MRRLFIALALTVCLLLGGASAWGALCWCAIADGAIIAVDEINCLVATDGSPLFNILLRNGGVVANVSTITFDMKNVVGGAADAEVDPGAGALVMRGHVLVSHAGDADRACVLGLDGRQAAWAEVADGCCDIDISGLAAGVYILSVGGRSFKFVKQ